MKIETCKIFALMCEGVLAEASSSMKLVQSKIGGREVVKYLHKELELSHEQQYKPIDKISWSQLKDSYRGSWVIIHGDKGTGAIKYRNSYYAIASDGGEVKTFSNDRGGNIIDFLKANIGQLRKFFVGKESGAVYDIKRKRQDAQKGAGPTRINQDALIKKFRPLWQKAVTAAIADVKGHVANMIKNDAFDKAKKKLEHISFLQGVLEGMETDRAGDAPGVIKNAVNSAVLMAASYYYPEQTGELVAARGYGYNGATSYNAQRSEGTELLIKDLSSGDTAKLGTVLAFFKRALISG